MPTRLLAADTAPLIPRLPSPQVTAPASDMVPLSQTEETTTKFPLVRVTTPPTISDAFLPTKLLAADTTPVIPRAPSTQVTAPASTMVLLSQLGDETTKLPLVKFVKVFPILSDVLLPTRLLAEEITPRTPLTPLPQVTDPASTAEPLSQPVKPIT